MNKAHSAINWENYPSDETPVNERNLNKMDGSIDIIDDRVITLDTTKATKAEVATLVADVTFEESTGIITVIKKNGSKITIDTQMEKIAVNFDYNPITQQIILTLIDGTKQYIDLSALITQYEFLDTETVTFSVDSSGKVSAVIKDGSIQERHLNPNYLAAIKVEVAKAQASQSAAATSESNALKSAKAAASSASAAKASETNAASSASASATSAKNAKTSETNAKASETNAKASETSAGQFATTAASKATSASQSAVTATDKAAVAAQKASEIIGKAESAAESAAKAKSYAVGGTGSRDGEDSDNAKYYFEQVKDVSEAIKGGLQPRGTVAFADLPQLADCVAGWMFNISDEFTTTADFKEGAGNTVPAGANIYKTSDEKWDVLAGTPVTGVKGAKEKSYRRGNVVLTAENIGAVPSGGNTAENTAAFTSSDSADGSASAWTNVSKLSSGEKHSSIFAKVSQMFKNVRHLYKMLGTTDISKIGNGTCTGAISSLNSSLMNLLRCDGGVQYYNAVKDINNFYNGICLVDGTVIANCPTNEWYAVMSVGLVGTRVQIAWYLWTGKMYTRYQSAGNWTAWENRSYFGDYDVIATAAGGTGMWEGRTVSSLSKYKFIQIQVRDGNFSEIASNITPFGHFKDCNTVTRTFGAWANDWKNVEYCGMASYIDDTNLRIYCGTKITQVDLIGWY